MKNYNWERYSNTVYFVIATLGHRCQTDGFWKLEKLLTSSSLLFDPPLNQTSFSTKFLHSLTINICTVPCVIFGPCELLHYSHFYVALHLFSFFCIFFFLLYLLSSRDAAGIQVLVMTLQVADAAPADFRMRGGRDGGFTVRKSGTKRQKKAKNTECALDECVRCVYSAVS